MALKIEMRLGALDDLSIKSPLLKKRRTGEEKLQKKGQDSNVRTFRQTSNQCSKAVLMNTLKVNVKDKHGNFEVVSLGGDSGSQSSFVNHTTLKTAETVWMEDERLQKILL